MFNDRKNRNKSFFTYGPSRMERLARARVARAEVFVDPAPDFGDLIGVDAPEPRVGCVAHLMLIAAHHGDPSRREVDPAGRQVPVPEPGVIAASGQVVSVHAGPNKTRAPDRLPG